MFRKKKIKVCHLDRTIHHQFEPINLGQCNQDNTYFTVCWKFSYGLQAKISKITSLIYIKLPFKGVTYLNN